MKYEIALALWQDPPDNYRTWALVRLSELLSAYHMDPESFQELRRQLLLKPRHTAHPFFEPELTSSLWLINSFYKPGCGFYCLASGEHCKTCYPDEEAGMRGVYLSVCAEGLEDVCEVYADEIAA